MHLKTLTAAAAAAALLAPAAASAHVTLQPKEIPAGGFARFDVRVPNEQDDAGTTKVAVKMPPGFYSASYEAQPGWSVKVAKRKLAEPGELHGEPVTEEIDTITWSGDGERGIIKPGEFKDFGISVAVPEGKAGSKLTFASTQTYEGGEVVRWIGPEEADKPAPVVTLTEASGGHAGKEPTANEAATAEHNDAVNAERQTSGVAARELDDKASKGLAIGALVLGALGLLVGIAGFSAGRRRSA